MNIKDKIKKGTYFYIDFDPNHPDSDVDAWIIENRIQEPLQIESFDLDAWHVQVKDCPYSISIDEIQILENFDEFNAKLDRWYGRNEYDVLDEIRFPHNARLYLIGIKSDTDYCGIDIAMVFGLTKENLDISIDKEIRPDIYDENLHDNLIEACQETFATIKMRLP